MILEFVPAAIPYQTITADDIGAFVAMAFERHEEFIGVDLGIAGSELTSLDAAQVFIRVLGKRVKFKKLPMPMARLFLGKESWIN